VSGKTKGEVAVRHSRMFRVSAILALGVMAAVVLAAAASAGPPVRDTIHVEGNDIVLEDFCDVEGLDATLDFVMDIRVHIVSHGPEGLEYFLQHGTRREVLTANGKSLTSFSRVTEKDMRVTDNGDGTVTVLILATGNAVLYDENGKAIARNPGQTRLVIVFDENGDELSREVVKGSTGRSDDFCDAAVPVLTGAS
jgi:hypothetical protein